MNQTWAGSLGYMVGLWLKYLPQGKNVSKLDQTDSSLYLPTLGRHELFSLCLTLLNVTGIEDS